MIHNELKRMFAVPRGAKIAAGLDAGAGGLERLSESLQTTFPVFEFPEWQHLVGMRRHHQRNQVTAGGAGTYAAAGLRIAEGSNLLAVIDPATEFFDSVAVAYTVSVYLCTYAAATSLLPNGQTPMPLDSRNVTAAAGVRRSITEARSGTPAAPVGSVLMSVQGGALGGAVPRLGVPFVLSPGWCLYAIYDSANLPLRCNWRWYEREALPGELEV